MAGTPNASRCTALRIAQQGAAPWETSGGRGIAELLLGVVLDATCGAAIPVMLTVQISAALRSGAFDRDARLQHAQGLQQQWLAELRQAGSLVSRAHVVVEAELPSSSYVPWHGGIRPIPFHHDDGIAHCLRVARLFDTAIRSRAGAFGLVPLWLTILYFGDAAQLARQRQPLTVSAVSEGRLGPLRQYEMKVSQGSETVAMLTTVYDNA
ncbi:hypothetical protein [Cupriavidus consociatus]|uniref:hypothetical protein n=1 Tax=Cupriavidus consociatus TaxID=2821357 RepID=UPI001AE2617E|nr:MULTISPECIES: hypothetical protein [unclassified Cupriavidus]MBP0618911.1 hypothetical protein [Cupriavidus sp. LEh25]MDK2655554.1 hypothetical protein [Cupriavidus sp. LEh21]